LALLGCPKPNAVALEYAVALDGTLPSMALDDSRDVYIAGNFYGTVGNKLTSAGRSDVIIQRLNSAGEVVWAKSMGGPSLDAPSAVALDSTDSLYVTGRFRATADFDPGPGQANLTAVGTDDIFVVKLDTSGQLIWARAIGGEGKVESYDIAVDASGNAYITGDFEDTADFDPGPGTAELTSVDDTDIFVCKLNSSGDFVWAKRLGGDSLDRAYEITVGPSNYVYFCGQMNSVGARIFTAKMNAVGDVLWSSSPGQLSKNDAYGWAFGLAVDDSGNVYATGSFSGTVEFDPGNGGATFTSVDEGDGSDMFVLKYDTMGQLIWARVIAGPGLERGNSVAVNTEGGVYTTGLFANMTDFDPGPGVVMRTSATRPYVPPVILGKKSYNPIHDGVEDTFDVFVCKLNAAGEFLWVHTPGGEGLDLGETVAVDDSGAVFTTGMFGKTVDFDPSFHNTNLVAEEYREIFLSKLVPSS
jgi:hypothetical protein